MTKLGSTLPQGGGNGLNSIGPDMVQNPEKIHVVVAIIDCKSITTNIDSGDIEPTARIRAIEPIDIDRDLVAKIMRRAQEQRTGKTVLPFEMEEDMRSAFGPDQRDET